MLIFDRDNWKTHRPWAVFCGLVIAASTVWYLVYGLSTGGGQWRWPSGASPPGITLGLAGGAIILFEMLLWPRKYLWRGLRLGRTKLWMTAHLWLGALVLPLLLLHGSFHFAIERSTLASVLMWLLVLVFLSGLLGGALQHMLPRVMLDQVPAETIYSQINHVLEIYHGEAEQLVLATCGAVGTGDSASRTRVEPAPFLVAETVVSVGPIQGRVVETAEPVALAAGAEALRVFHDKYVGPYLRAKSGRSLPLGLPARAAAHFHELRSRLPKDVHPVVQRLEELCNQRRQFDSQRRLHHWLHAWMAIHLLFSAALLVLMLAHVYLSLSYV
jgi:hypothetical protein